MTRIVLELESRRLHAISDGDLQTTVVLGRAEPTHSPELVSVLELESGETWSLPRDFLAKQAVGDDEVYSLLQDAGIDGTRETAPLSTPGSCLPVSGNLVDPTWISINLSGHCDSHCAFCYTDQIRRKAGLSRDEVSWALRCGRDAGAAAVAFTGGEPTLRRDLRELIEEARQVGFEEIQIQTNGHRLAKREYLAELVLAGMTKVLLSMHGPEASVHDEVAQQQGSFHQACDAILNLRRVNASLTVNFVVCRSNGHRAADMIDLLASKHPSARLRFSFLIIEGAAHDCAERIVPTFTQFVEWVGSAVSRAHRHGLVVEAANVPPCISTALGLPVTYDLAQRRAYMSVSPFYREPVRRGEVDVKLDACAPCASSSVCGGIQLAYLAHIPNGATHVRPVEPCDDHRHEKAPAEAGALKVIAPSAAQ